MTAAAVIAPPACPVCQGGATPRRPLAGATAYECPDCGFLWVYPLPRVASPSAGAHTILTHEGYTDAMIADARSGYPDPARLRRMAELRLADVARRTGRPCRRVFEVGCGSSELGPHYRACGAEYAACELDPRAAASARAKGLDVTDGDFMDLRHCGYFQDLICFSQVLEHITDPVAFVSRVRDWLVPGGVVNCDVPNHDALYNRLSRLTGGTATRYGALEAPHHLFAYRKQSLARLLAPHFDATAFALSSDDPCWGQPRLAPRWHWTAYRTAARLLRCPNLLVAVGTAR